MKRRHLFELEDQRWFPSGLRRVVTDFLREALVVEGRVYTPAALLVAQVVKASRAQTVVDLCSGGSGPWSHLKAEVEAVAGPVELVLTDKYPDPDAMGAAVATIGDGRTRTADTPVDALAVPPHLTGVRTLFTSFHHFAPDRAAAILRDAHLSGSGIAVFEFTERDVRAVARTVVLAPVLVWATLPRLRREWRWWVLTYLVPVVPVVVTWDGVVSNLRTYTPDELLALTDGLDSADYVWEAGRVEGSGRTPPITYLLGHPTDARTREHR